MNKNLSYIIFIIVLSFGACSETPEQRPSLPSSEKSVPKMDSSSKVGKSTEEIADNPHKNEENQEKKEAFILTTDNAVAFLRDYGRKNKENKAVIHTDFGSIYVKLSNKAPLHRAAFVYLVKNKYFDNTLFYRVSPDFLIQGGNTNDLSAIRKKTSLGNFELPQEFDEDLFHEVGALAACMDYEGNPKKLSNPYNFYIIAGGRVYSTQQVSQLPGKFNVDFSPKALETYQKGGGQPHLDQKHTVFGKVYQGMSVVRKINQVETDASEWPRKNIKMRVELLP